MSEPIDFWFSIGSTYTYLTVMRIDEEAKRAGVTFRWRPFDVRAIMVAMNNIPFSTKPVKERYMWRDLERRTQLYGIPWSGIPHYPLKHLTFVNRIALMGAKEGWCGDYVRSAYRRWFGKRRDISVEPDLSETLCEIGRDPIPLVALAASDVWKAALENETETASALGIFGAPTFAVGKEIFWGDDRMGDAIAWQRGKSVRVQSLPTER
jgi:2-hydroxychromene-2-carboxylate isomerase